MSKKNITLIKCILIAAFTVCITAIIISCTAMAPTETKVEVKLPTCRTEKCHSEIGVKEYVHMPVRKGACVMCHKLVVGKHPDNKHDSADFEIWGKKDIICYVCHERMDNNEVVHQPVLTGDCTSCHDPHQSDYPLRLKNGTSREICFSCHKDFVRMVENSPYAHTPVKKGECDGCHTSHSAKNQKLLKWPISEKTFVTFNINNFVLCWECHNKELVTDALTEDYTNFRNGNVNLHNKHIDTEKNALNCIACHEIHIATQPKNMTISVYKKKGLDGGSDTPDLKYIEAETGGVCEVSCHERKEYDRVTPVKYK